MSGAFCEVVGSTLCTAPPRLGKPNRRNDRLTYAECFACGCAVCTACSLRVSWFGFGSRRIGFDCLRSFGREAEVEAHFAREAMA